MRPAPPLQKTCHNFGLPWETQIGYAQAVRAGDWLYISGQLSHDEQGQIVAPAPLDNAKNITSFANMESQMRQAYVNAGRVLTHFGAEPNNIVEEVLYVLDMDSAFAAGRVVREVFYGKAPRVACTMLVTPRLAFAEQLIEIKFVAKL